MTKSTWFRAVTVCLVACLFCSYQFMLQGSTSVMLPELMDGLHIDLSEVGWVTSAFLYAYLICQVPGGVVADYLDGRWTLSICCLLLAIACFTFAYADSFLKAVLSRTLMGIATAPGIVICLTLMMRWFPKHWFPFLSGFVESMALLGGAVGPLVLPGLIQSLGLQDSMLVVGLCGIGLSLLMVLIVRSRPSHGHQMEPEATVQKQGYEWTLMLKNPQFWLYCLYGFGTFMFISVFASLWGVPFLKERFPDSARLAETSISMIFIGLAIGAPLLGFLVARFGRCRLFMLLSVLLQLLCTFLIVYCDCSDQWIPWHCFLVGMCCSGYLLVFTMLSNSVPESTTGVALAIGNGFMLLGAPVMQPLIGHCLDLLSAGSGQLDVQCFRVAFILLLASQLLALACLLMSFWLSSSHDNEK